jgi:hypothetical protein
MQNGYSGFVKNTKLQEKRLEWLEHVMKMKAEGLTKSSRIN